ncbi:MAG: RNA polymerase sigma factor [Candidimonas sp.]|nr:MAG: RNA polymerase sigma factor [Candidimonas sp.]
MSSETIDDQLRELLPRLKRFALWLTHDGSRADDLVQSTLERALSRWHTRTTDAVRPWLFAIAYRLFLDQQRRARRYARVLEFFRGRAQIEARSPSAEHVAIEHAIIRALKQLPEPQRRLLLWISVEGLSYREVADILRVPVGTVMSRLSRARAALRRCAEGHTMRVTVSTLGKQREKEQHISQ